MQSFNLYKILGVAENASQNDIKQAYRAKARQAHPDKGGSEEAMRALNQAYEILSNQHMRDEYDQLHKEYVATSSKPPSAVRDEELTNIEKSLYRLLRKRNHSIYNLIIGMVGVLIFGFTFFGSLGTLEDSSTYPLYIALPLILVTGAGTAFSLWYLLTVFIKPKLKPKSSEIAALDHQEDYITGSNLKDARMENIGLWVIVIVSVVFILVCLGEVFIYTR